MFLSLNYLCTKERGGFSQSDGIEVEDGGGWWEKEVMNRGKLKALFSFLFFLYFLALFLVYTTLKTTSFGCSATCNTPWGK